jgi:hypothetical protein
MVSSSPASPATPGVEVLGPLGEVHHAGPRLGLPPRQAALSVRAGPQSREALLGEHLGHPGPVQRESLRGQDLGDLIGRPAGPS